MIRALLTILFISAVLHSSLLAQNKTAERNTNSLEGVLRDMHLDERIPFAKVALFQNENLVRGEDTDAGGNYSFTDVPAGIYQVKASFYGYDFVDITEVQIEDKKKKIADLDLELKDELYAPVAVVGAVVKRHVHRTICYGIVSAEKTQEETQTKEISTRSKPGPFARDPYDTPSDLLLYPNPTSGVITMEIDSEQINIQLINPLGQFLGAVAYNEVDKDKIQIDLSALAAGTYFLNIRHDQGTQVEKVVIVHL